MTRRGPGHRLLDGDRGHNAALAIFVAVEILESVTVSVPAAAYAVLLFPLAAIWGSIVSRQVRRRVAAA